MAGEPGKVYAAALRVLSRRDHSEYELRQKLYDRGADREAVDTAIDCLHGYGYLDELRIAENLIHYHCNYKPVGRLLLRQKMTQKGIGDEYIEQAMNEYYTEDDEQCVLADLIAKKMADLDNFPTISEINDQKYSEYAEQKNKKTLLLVRRLERRGFPLTMIWKEITKISDKY